jgi:hypothetical protein
MYSDPAGDIGLGETAFPQQGLDHLDGFGSVELRDRPLLPMVLPSGGDVNQTDAGTVADSVLYRHDGSRLEIVANGRPSRRTPSVVWFPI